MKRVIEYTEDGSATLYVPTMDEHYHSTKGARTESQHIFVEMGLKASKAKSPRILEVGFGTGLNAIVTLEEAKKLNKEVHYTGVEFYPLSWEEVSVLNYSQSDSFKLMHHVPWQEEAIIEPHFTLLKMKQDINVMLSLNENGELIIKERFDIIYFDAFAPEKQPEMWSQELFDALYKVLNNNGILTTYCAKGVVRRMLQQAGFIVERLAGPPGGKREILRANKI